MKLPFRRRTPVQAPGTWVAAAIVMLAAPPVLSAQQGSLAARVDDLFAEWDHPDSPGCALGVIRDGALIYTRGYGSANLDYEVPLDARSVFYMASVSKQFTAAAVALAAYQGHFSLDDDIRAYFPELPDYGATITVRHLIHHTSGIRDYLTLMRLAGMRRENVHTDAEILSLITRQKELNFPPGERYLYSNSGYFLLAELIERTTGRTFRDYTTEHLFEPLGMMNTHFHTDPRHVQKRRAVSYSASRSQGFRISFLANFDKVGSGGLYSTVEDMLRWDRNFYDSRIGGPGFIDRLLTRGVLNSGEVLDYAFGLRIDAYKGLPTVSHAGSMMGYKTAFLRFPEQRFSVVCLCNLGSIDPMALSHRVADLYLADTFALPSVAAADEDADDVSADSSESPHAEYAAPRPRPSPAPTPIQAYTGRYRSDELLATYEIDSQDGTLFVHLADGSRRRADPLEYDVFEAGSYELHFVRDEAGRIAGFDLMAGRVRNLRFVRLP